MQTRQEFIDKYCGGDTSNYDTAIAQGRREVIAWDQLETYTNVYPELEPEAHDLIKKHLGYLPEPAAYIPHETFIRALIHQYKKRQLSELGFHEDVVFHIKHIRNDDMNQGGWIDNLGEYTAKDKERYSSYFSQYTDKARARLQWLLGYEPDIKDSLYSELLLRELCSVDWYHDGMPPTATDYKAMTILLYREAIKEHGKAFADQLPMLAINR